MPSDVSRLFPAYATDLRGLVTASVSGSTGVPLRPAPGGPIRSRVEVELAGHAERVSIDADEPVSGAYWRSALAQKLFIPGVLLDLADAGIDLPERLRIERHLLVAYYWTYSRIPLSCAVLRMIQIRHRSSPEEGLVEWLDQARREVLSSDSLESADRARARLRLVALRLGATKQWTDRTVATAELMTDVLLLARACVFDVRHAYQIRALHDGSISRAMAHLDRKQDLAFERALPLVLRVDASSFVLSGAEWDQLNRFAETRFEFWRGNILMRSVGTGVVAAEPNPPVTPPRPTVTPEPTPAAQTQETTAEPARAAYSRIRVYLEQRIIGQPEVCGVLALHGVAFLSGVTGIRILLVGGSGSGKTFSARTFAAALCRPFCAVDAGDLSETGFKGLNIGDLLDGLRSEHGGSLDGAVLQIDEIDKAVRRIRGVDGNVRAAREGLSASLLALLDGKPVTPEVGPRSQIQTDKILVLGTGAFAGRFVDATPSTQDLVAWGWQEEFAARWTDRLCLVRPGRATAMDLLRRSDRSVGARFGRLLAALEMDVEVPDAVLGFVAETWLRTGADFRTASEWVLSAAKRRLIEALESGAPGQIVLSPDDIVIPGARRRGRWG